MSLASRPGNGYQTLPEIDGTDATRNNGLRGTAIMLESFLPRDPPYARFNDFARSGASIASVSGIAGIPPSTLTPGGRFSIPSRAFLRTAKPAIFLPPLSSGRASRPDRRGWLRCTPDWRWHYSFEGADSRHRVRRQRDAITNPRQAADVDGGAGLASPWPARGRDHHRSQPGVDVAADLQNSSPPASGVGGHAVRRRRCSRILDRGTPGAYCPQRPANPGGGRRPSASTSSTAPGGSDDLDRSLDAALGAGVDHVSRLCALTVRTAPR